MNVAKVVCPRCGQDWLERVHLNFLEQDAILCPECDALWLKEGDVAPPVEGSYGVTWHDYGDYMRAHGRPQPETLDEITVVGKLLRPHWRSPRPEGHSIRKISPSVDVVERSQTVNAVEILARELGWRFIPRGQASNAAEGFETIVVVAPQWSQKDIELLRSVASRLPVGVLVEVTDIDFLVGAGFYSKVLPGAPLVTQTPVLAHYSAGRLVQLSQGPDQVENYPS